jgi:hypothetical protein
MGLTGGLVDAGNLFDCLYGIATGQLDDSILDKYSEIRIQKYNDIINPISSSNIRRLWDPSPEAIKSDPFFQAVERAEKDKEFAEEMKKVSPKFYDRTFDIELTRIQGLSAVMHDFTQYYKPAAEQNGA